MPDPTAAIQLIVFGERNRTDMAGVLRDVASAGFTAIEAGNLFQSLGESEARRLLDANGLSVCGAHFGYREFEDAGKLAAHIAYCKALSIRHLMCSGVANTETAEGYRHSCKVFNEVGARVRDEGLVFNYHNHAWEFDDLGGVNGMQILAAETDPNLVKFNLDVFWLWFGRQDSAVFIQERSERAGYFHFKDGRRAPDGKPVFLELGRGDVDLRSAFEAARAAGAEWIVYEQDRTELPHLEAATISRRYLKNALGV